MEGFQLSWMMKQKITEIIANALLIGGGVLIAMWPLSALIPWSFVTFLMGHVIWAGIGFYEQRQGIIWMNSPLVFLDLYAILIRI